MSTPLRLDAYDFDLPKAHIAQEPARPRDAARLMVLPRRGGEALHSRFFDLNMLLKPGDLLVVNRTRVMPARLVGRKASGGRVELLLHRPIDGGYETARLWESMGRPLASLRAGQRIVLDCGALLEVCQRKGTGILVRGDVPLWTLMQRHGAVPLPPYVERGARPEDATDYQTIFAEEPGAVAAPTASLHFTPRVMERLEQRGVRVRDVLLHVGPGTFLPVRPEHADDVRKHQMHAEFFKVPAATSAAIDETRKAGGRVVAVGTTSLRALESGARMGAHSGESTLFIYPGYEFVHVDALLTNFHLPRSTLLLLVSAMAGRARVLAAYREAVQRGYRFFSFGDAMLII